ncbi:MAG TPA: ATP-dependent DNA helicase [Candidatus Onthovivens sp.]|nr:ATP-dependent DNA helicase [Candidatus Onthovivens sp.]
MKVLEIGVHEIIDFILRKGDIDNRYFNETTMLEGTRLHKYYQDRQGEDYEPEVLLQQEIVFKDIIFKISGRADGIYTENDDFIIDEIKTTNSDLNYFHETNFEWHLGQAEFYAYMYLLRNKLSGIKICLTYISQIDKTILKKYYNYTKNQIEVKIFDYLDRYHDFYSILDNKTKFNKENLKNVKFPFKELRFGQEKFISYTYDAIKNNTFYYIEASTGIGKTASAIYATIKGIEENFIDQIFYLSAKNTGFINTIKTIDAFGRQGAHLITTQITSKDKACINEDMKGKCNPKDCKYAVNYYTKLNKVLSENIEKYDIFDRKRIIKIALDNTMCPFELGLDFTNYSQYIICDYNYIYHPISYLQRFIEEENRLSKTFLLVDEAHNLVDRSRDMYSSILSYNIFKKCAKDLKKAKKRSISSIINKIDNRFKELKQNLLEDQSFLLMDEPDENLNVLLASFNEKLLIFKDENTEFITENVTDFSRQSYNFVKILEFFDERYRYYLSIEQGDFKIVNRCLDASDFLNHISSKMRGGILFSGTLQPKKYYKETLINNDKYGFVKIQSNFKKDNFLVLVNRRVSLKYSKRNETFEEVQNQVKAFISGKVGNYMIFCPSYAYLNKFKNQFELKKVKAIFQRIGMKNEEKDDFLNNLSLNPKKTTVAFCVLGGMFSEGIDLEDDRLIGVVVIGVGMPSYNQENLMSQNYFDEKGLNGFNYSFLYPGMSKVLQAIGRVIRSENDIGAALLIDTRYGETNYLNLLNNDHDSYKLVESAEDIEKQLKTFYQYHKK